MGKDKNSVAESMLSSGAMDTLSLAPSSRSSGVLPRSCLWGAKGAIYAEETSELEIQDELGTILRDNGATSGGER